MRKCLRTLWLVLVILIAIFAAAYPKTANGQTFVHPGALNTQADFDRIQTEVNSGQWPWYDSYVNLCNDSHSSLSYGWHPVTQIVRGSGGGNNFALSQQDAIAIYELALRWRISGSNQYADKAIQGMDAWSSTMTAGPTGDNWGLASGLCGYEFAVAAETLKGYTNWSQTSIDNYKAFLGYFATENISFLANHGGWYATHPRSNWDIDNEVSLAACGVFCDNAAWFNQAINYFKYGGGVGLTGNGQVQLWAWFLHPEGSAQMEESGRDQAHCDDAIASMSVLCEIAWNQGVDLFGYDNNRFLRGAEYFAKYNSGVDVPYTAYFNAAPWPGGYWESNIGSGSRGAFLPVWDMLNTHFVQKGIYAPYTDAYAAARRPTGNIGNWNSPDYFGYDTLTHYQAPPTTDLPPSGLLVNYNSRQATVSWFGTPRATSYNVKRSTVSGGPYTTITTTGSNTISYVDDQVPRGPTYYYVVSANTPSGETANCPEAVAGCVTRYNFNGDALDSVGTLNGTLACDGSSGLPGFTTGYNGNQALLLNGSNQYVQLPLGVLTHEDITISTWVKWGGGNAWQRIFDTAEPNHNRDMFLTVNDGSQMKFFITDNWYPTTLYAPRPAVNTWTQVAVTIKTDIATLYVNGVPVDTEWIGTQPLFGQTFTYIGKSMYSNDPYFNGAIQDFRVYNYALSGAELYNVWGQGSNQPPVFTSDPNTCDPAWDSVPYQGHSIYPTAADPNGGPLTFTMLSGPSWLTVAGNGQLSGTPTNNDVGLETFNVRVTDSSGATDDATFYITVNNTNQDPVWTSSTITLPSVTCNEPYSYVNASLATSSTDVDIPYGDAITYTKVSGPAWLTVSPSGSLSGTPGTSDTGSNVFVVRVTDSSGAYADATLNITVFPYALRSQYNFENDATDSISGLTGAINGKSIFSPGYSGNCITLDGSNAYVSLPSAAVTYKEITVAAWVYWNGGNAWQRIFDFGNDTSHYFFLTPYSGSAMHVGIDNGSGEQGITSSTALPVGRWTHVAVTLSGSVATLFVNGTAAGSNSGITISPADINPKLNYIGLSQFSNDPHLNGSIDDFRIYNYALSAAELSALVNSLPPAAPTGLSDIGGNGAPDVLISWNPASAATGYNLFRSLTSGTGYTLLYSGTATSYTDTNTAAGVSYYYVVNAVNATGTSANSSEISVQGANADTPKVYLRLDESSGTTASDSSGNGWNGTLVNGPAWTAGIINNGLLLTGSSSQYVTLPSGVVSNLNDFTISAWVKLTSATNWSRLFDIGTGTTKFMYLVPGNGSGNVQFGITTNGWSAQQQISTSYTIPIGTWTHVAVTLSGTVGTVYINGTSVGTNSAMTLNPSSLGITTQNYIGKSQFSNDPYLNSTVDEFKIYGRALKAAEISNLAGTPAVPTGLTATPGNAQNTLSWNASAGATGYNLKRATVSGGPYTIVAGAVSGTNAVDSSPINGTTYYYVVTALSGFAESANSAEVSVTPVGAPPVPTGLTATGSNSVVNLSWTPSSGATSYNVERSVTSGSGYVTTGSTAKASYSDSAITNGTAYYYVVTAVGPNGESAESAEASATPMAPPSVPANLVATASNAVVTLNWAATASATSYNVKRSTTSGTGYTVIATTTIPGYFDSALANGTVYYYVVSALNAGGESANSTQASAIPVAPPSAPSRVWTYSGNAQIGLAWPAVTGATSYNVKRSMAPGGPYAAIASGISATVYFDTPLANGTSYYYIVSAVNAGGEGTNSAQVSAVPAVTPLQAYLRFDETSGTTASDSSGNGWNGTLVNGPTWAAGKINNGVVLNSSSSQYVTFPAGVIAGLKDFTITAWVKLNSISANSRIFDFGTGGTPGAAVGTYMFLTPKDGAGNVRFAITTSGYNNEQSISAVSTLTTGTWTHVAVALSGSTGTLYVNGTAVSTNNGMRLNPSSLGSTSQNYIGKSQYSSDPYLNGTVDEFKIYGRALSSSEISALVNPPSAPTGLSANPGNGQMALVWNTVAGVTGYNLKRSYVNGGPYATLATLSGTAYTDTGLTNSSPYYYVVTAVNGLGESANSSQVSGFPGFPTITSPATATGVIGTAVNYPITATCNPTSYGASGLPAGLSLNTNTGVISGTPTVTGTFNATITASNPLGTGSATLTVNVAPPPPVITSPASASGTNRSAFSYQITATNSPTGYAASGLPGGLSVNTSTGLISGTPAVSGTFSATISASNAGGSGSASLIVTIAPAAPVIDSATSVTGTDGSAFTYQITASDNPTSFGESGLPAGMSLNSATGVISGIPTAAGTFNAMIVASNAVGSGSASLTILVLPTPPVISSAAVASGTYGSAFSYQITATNNPTSYGASGLPAGLVLNTSTGVISGTPALSGTFSVIISASNAGGTGSGALSIAVAATVPAAPTGLTATGTNAAVVLTWNASAEATSYNVKRSLTNGSGYTTILNGVTTVSCTDITVTVGGTYYYVVSAVNSAGESPNSAQASATPTLSRDYFTQLFAAGSNNTASTSFLFTPANNINGYVVSRTGTTAFPVNPSGGTTLSEGDDTSVAVTLSGTAKVVLFGTSYSTFYVGSNGYITFNTTDTSWDTSLSTHFNQPRISPLFVDLDTSSGGSVSWKQLSDRVVVTWQNVPDYGKTDSNSFQVEMFFDGRIRITLLAIVATPSSNSDGSIIGLSKGGGLPAGFVSSNFSAYPPPPATVSNLVATGTNAAVSLSWTSVNGATSYNVKRSVISGSGYATIASGVTTAAYTDTGLSNGLTYYYVVSAVNVNIGEGSDSGQASATPIAPPVAPTGVVATGSDGFVTLTWNTVNTAVSYSVERSVTSGVGYTIVASGVPAASYTDSSVTNGTTYYYVVTAANAGGVSPTSTETTARPSAPITAAEEAAPDIALSSNGAGGSNATMTVKASVVGHTYQLQYTTDLVSGTWQNAGASQVGNGSDLQFVTPVSSADAHGFYRIIIQQ